MCILVDHQATKVRLGIKLELKKHYGACLSLIFEEHKYAEQVQWLTELRMSNFTLISRRSKTENTFSCLY